MISELYVPRPALDEFLSAAARSLRAHEADVVYGTVRLVERDDETVLAWAREPWACIGASTSTSSTTRCPLVAPRTPSAR